jgi:hypothetical protein
LAIYEQEIVLQNGNTEGRIVLTMKKLDSELKAYLAGFLDGDGCINAQLIRRTDYRLGFQIRISITFFQSTKRYWFFLQLKKILQTGSLRKRNDGISEYSIVGSASVKDLCQELLPFLRLKKNQAILVLEIVKKLHKNQSFEDFLNICSLVDEMEMLNDSKRRTVTRAYVESVWKEEKLFPVETSENG